MSALRELWSQLVERRLWPVALGLVAGLAAAPVLLAKSPEPAAERTPDLPPAVTAAGARVDEAAETFVTLVGDRDAGVALRGRAKDPFKQPQPPRPALPGGSSAGGGGPGPSPTPGDGGRRGGTGGGGGSGDGAPTTYTYATIDVTFGEAGGRLREIKRVPRLAALPGNDDPAVIFLGMRGDHETAVFLVSSDVRVQGDARCLPSLKVCETIELRQNGVVFLDVRAEDGSITQYELNLVAVELHQTTDQERARRTEARGARVALRELASELPRARSGRAGAARAFAPAPAGAGRAELTPLP